MLCNKQPLQISDADTISVTVTPENVALALHCHLMSHVRPVVLGFNHDGGFATHSGPACTKFQQWQCIAELLMI